VGNHRPYGGERWFSTRLDKESAPWAFAKGEPLRAIASLEMFAALLCIVAFGDGWPSGATGGVALQGITDNLGNTLAVARLMTSKFPLVVILAEPSAQLRRRGMELSLQWVPRDQNTEADALTNEEFGAFDPAKRVAIDLSRVSWCILPRLMRVAQELYGQIQAVKASGAPPKAAGQEASHARRTRKGLRQRDPW